jgi:uncharacterized protein
MKDNLISLGLGLLFGIGLTLSGMTQPAKVIGFLDLAGNWNPALAFVMGGAIMIYMPIYFFFLKKRSSSLLGNNMEIPSEKPIDKKLLSGAAIFGIGWGMGGFCPGPAVTAMATGFSSVFSFMLALLAGMLSFQVFFEKN